MKPATAPVRGPRRPAFTPFFAVALAVALPAAVAQALTVVNQPWVRPAAAGHSTEAFMNLGSTEGATLVAARSEIAAATMLHRPGRDARAAAELALPAGAIVELAPGKYRLSLRRVNKGVKLGDIVPLTLTIRSVDGVLQDIAVRAVARLRSPVDDERRAHRRQGPRPNARRRDSPAKAPGQPRHQLIDPSQRHEHCQHAFRPTRRHH